MRRQAVGDRLLPCESPAGERHALPYPWRDAGSCGRKSHVGGDANVALGHGQKRRLGDDAKLRRTGEAQAESHANTIHEANHWNSIFSFCTELSHCVVFMCYLHLTC